MRARVLLVLTLFLAGANYGWCQSTQLSIKKITQVPTTPPSQSNFAQDIKRLTKQPNDVLSKRQPTLVPAPEYKPIESKSFLAKLWGAPLRLIPFRHH